MERKEYSAGAVKLSFWFIEFRKVVELLHEGKNAEQIKSLALNENLFAAPTTLRANQIYHTVTGRIRALDESFIPLFRLQQHSVGGGILRNVRFLSVFRGIL